jgi:hypothetical protein
MKNQVSDKNFFLSNETKLLLTLPTGSRIEFKSGEKPDNLYGDDVYAAVIDEASRMREESWYALRSTLTATQGKCKLIGNVKGKKNWFYKLGERARQGEAEYKYFKITAYDAAREGIISEKEIEQAKRDLPDYVFRELYLAEPADDKSNPFGLDAIRKCYRPISSMPVVAWGVDLQAEHERFITEKHIKGPVILYNYPKEIKAFYMRLNEDGKTVRAMDVLVPRLGEIVGGSQREERYDVLLEKIRTQGLDEASYWWYLELRKFGTVPHSGFGLGFERLLMYVTGMQNIRDVIAFPRFPGFAKF